MLGGDNALFSMRAFDNKDISKINNIGIALNKQETKRNDEQLC